MLDSGREARLSKGPSIQVHGRVIHQLPMYPIRDWGQLYREPGRDSLFDQRAAVT
jgi:hypothetical protein